MGKAKKSQSAGGIKLRKQKSSDDLAKEGAAVAFFGAASAVARWLTHIIPGPEEVYAHRQKALPKPKKSLPRAGKKPKGQGE